MGRRGATTERKRRNRAKVGGGDECRLGGGVRESVAQWVRLALSSVCVNVVSAGVLV